ncbi:MAG: TIGR01777 family oxidoreductase [Candidatus Hydrogenedentes bacterium]|nr:TIGR01777 family oxidoreductase [Candidatus Hydrogenedentota bacterium]
MKIVIGGSTGFVGSALVERLKCEGHEITRLVRSPNVSADSEILWAPSDETLDASQLEGFDALIHLSGENVAGRWTQEKKRRILESRIKSTRLLCKAITSLDNPPRTWLCASAIGYYGSRDAEILTEDSEAGEGFLAGVCQAWEAETLPAARTGIRVVNMRIGLVLSPDGGALKLMLKPFKLGLGGPLGNGRQYMSWSTLPDLLGAITFLLAAQDLSGPVNIVAPDPVTNDAFTKTLGKVLSRPAFVPVPAFGVKALLGSDAAEEMLLASQRVAPRKLESAGFHWQHPELEGAFRALLDK